MELIKLYDLSKKYRSSLYAGEDMNKIRETGEYTESFPAMQLLKGNVVPEEKQCFIESVYSKKDLSSEGYCPLGRRLKEFAVIGTLKVFVYRESYMTTEMKEITEFFTITHRADGAYLALNRMVGLRMNEILHINYESYTTEEPKEESNLPWEVWDEGEEEWN